MSDQNNVQGYLVSNLDTFDNEGNQKLYAVEHQIHVNVSANLYIGPANDTVRIEGCLFFNSLHNSFASVDFPENAAPNIPIRITVLIYIFMIYDFTTNFGELLFTLLFCD